MAVDDHGQCPHCQADLNGGSIWETGYNLALSNGGDAWPTVPASSPQEAEDRADKYAAAYGATRTSGRWGRQIGICDMTKDMIVEWRCPDCHKTWPR